jgi:hypothetical protein
VRVLDLWDLTLLSWSWLLCEKTSAVGIIGFGGQHVAGRFICWR